MSTTRIPKKAVAAYITSSLAYAGSSRWQDEEMLAAALTCYRAVVGMGLSHIPFFLVFDLRMIAEYGVSFTFASEAVPGIDPGVRSRYENQILNRLLREYCVQQAMELLAFYKVHADQDTDNAEAHAPFAARADRLTLLLLERIAAYWPHSHQINAAHLRELMLETPGTEAIVEATATLAGVEGAPDWAEMIQRFVDAATGAAGSSRRAVMWSTVVRAEDLFELEHLDVLNRAYLRRQVRNLIAVRESLPLASPHDFPLREETNEVESRFLDQSQYPTGGFSELTNRGSFENLVLSELIYMGEGIDEDEAPAQKVVRDLGMTRRIAIDLFDVRFVEGELLFYSRDSGQLLRKRRTIHLLVDMRQPLNIKYPDHPYQLGTMVVGVVLAMVRDLVLLFLNDALRFHLHLLYAQDEDEDEAETDPIPEAVLKQKEVLSILLDSAIQHGILDIDTIDGSEGFAPSDLANFRRKAYFIGFSSAPRHINDWAEALRAGRRASPPLFGAAIDLADGEGDAEEVPQPGVIRLDLSTSTLAELKHAILENITTQ